MASQTIQLGPTISTNGTTPSGAAGGDLSGTYPNPAVASVGGSSAANVHTSQLATAAATDANTASTIVKRDASGNFAAGTIKIGNGSAGAPSLTFASDTTTGMHDGGGQFALAVGGADALSMAKSTSGFGNVGMGGPASTGDGFPLLLSRELAGDAVVVQIANPSPVINSRGVLKFSTGGGNWTGDIQQFGTSTVEPYDQALVIRSTDSTSRVVIMGGQAGNTVEVYTNGDYSAGGKTATFNADHSTTLYGGIIINTGNAARPVAGSAYRGMVFVVQGGAGVADTLQVCLKSAADTYSWVTIGTG